MLSSVLLLLIAGSAAAQDETAPIVDVPEDVPGADVIVFHGDSYTFDSSQSTDDTRIVLFTWEFKDGEHELTLSSTTGRVTYTFVNMTQTWVIVTAFDPAGNEGKGYFSIDVVEKVTGDLTIRDSSVTYDHSVYVENGDVIIDNSDVYFGEGAGSLGGGSGSVVPDQMGESITPGGQFSGEWHPYYYDMYQNNYGYIELDSNYLFSGDYSIKCRPGSNGYSYGFEYQFEEPQDLTEYDYLSFWFHSTYSSNYHYMLYLWAWDDTDYRNYMYIYNMYNGGYTSYRGWQGISYDLNIDKVGYQYSYGSFDITNVGKFWVYCYSYSGTVYVDHVGIYEQEEPGDPICEDVTNSGLMAGEWKSSYKTAPKRGSRAYVGDASIDFELPYSSPQIYIRYVFDQPTDLSKFHALRMYTYSTYAYTYSSPPSMTVYSPSGYCTYYDYSTKYLNYYCSYNDGKWDFKSFGWGPYSGLYQNTGIDWTQVTEIRFTNIYSYGSPSSTLTIDGLDWVALGGTGAIPTDTVPLTIYNVDGDTYVQDSTVTGIGRNTGARIVTEDGDATFQRTRFDNIWTSNTQSAGNALNVMGGLEVYGNAVIGNVTFINCKGPGLALFDGTYLIDRTTTDLSGTTLGMKMAPKLIMGVTDKTVGQYSMDISGWTLKNSPKGTGILIMFKETTASIDLTISGNDVDDNRYAGIVISTHGGGMYSDSLLAGPTANLDVVIKDQVIEDCGKYALLYYAGGGTYDANVWTTLMLDNVTMAKTDKAGLAVWLDRGGTNLDMTLKDSLIYRNTGLGTDFMFNGFFGSAVIDIQNTTISDNADAGISLYAQFNPYTDQRMNSIHPVASLDLIINSSSINGNRDWGILETLNGWDYSGGGVAPPWTWDGPTQTTLWYNATMTYSEITENQAGGWGTKSEDVWMNADMVAHREILGSTFADNRGNAIGIDPTCDLRSGGSYSDVWTLEDSFIRDNSGGGISHDLGTNNFGYTTEVHIIDVEFTDNDGDAIAVTTNWATDGLRRWGLSRVTSALYVVDDCHINSPVMFQLAGADDSANPSWDSFMGLQFTNNYLTIDDVPVEIFLEAYPYCNDFTARAEIGNNKYYRGFPGDGVRLEMMGGWSLDVDVMVYDLAIDTPAGSGLNFVAGTLAPSPEPHKLTGTVMVDNITIEDAMYNGINFTVYHKSVTGAKSLATLEVRDVFIDDVEHGIIANNVIGAIYDTVVSDPRASSVQIQYSTFDFFSCDVGPVDVSNIEVLIKGAARMWYSVGVDVKWADGSRVLGSSVTVQDNTWSIIAVDTVNTDDVLNIGYVNSYTILSDSVFSKTPFTLSASYLGLVTTDAVDINSNRVVELILIDNVMPRLTVNVPIDGSSQRKTTLEVKGHAWDMHSGLDEVMVSIDDGFTWFVAEGQPEFEYTFTDVEEGTVVLMVKAMDIAGNERTEYIGVVIDVTAPPIIVIEPANDIILTRESELDVVGVTEMGATVLVNNEEIPLDHTLFRTTVELKEGENEVRIQVMDRLGNYDNHVIKVTVDTIPPPLMVTQPMEGEVFGKRTAYVVGQTERGATVLVNGMLSANQMGTFSHNVVLTEGPNAIMITAEDKAGNVATAIVHVSLDTTRPWLELASPADGAVFGGDGIEVIGWVEAGSVVTVNDQEIQVVNGHFSAKVMGKEGRNSIVVTVTDMANNEFSKTVEVWFDTTPPVIELDSPADGLITAEDTVDVVGQLLWNEERENFRDITLSINGEFAPFAADGKFQIRYDLSEGTNPLFIRATDDVGNFVVTTVTVVRDSTAPFLLVEPTPTFDHPTWNKPSTYNALVYIEGVTEVGAMVTVDGSSVEVDNNGAFNVSVLLSSIPKDEELVQHSIVVVAIDAAGNYREETVEVYRLEKEETTPSFMDYESAQYWVLLLSIIILVVAIVATAFLWRRMGATEEEYIEDRHDRYLEEV